MKQSPILIVALLAASLYAQAQVKVEGGVKAGININTVKYKHSDGEMASVGYHVGGLARIILDDRFFIQPELQYSLKGYRFPAVGGAGSGTVRFHYIAIPLLAGFPIGDKFGFLIGPEIGFMTKAKSKFASGTIEVSRNFQDFDWGLDLGATCQITKNLGGELRYNYGFRGLVKGITTDENGAVTGSMRDGANRVFQAGLFYLF